MDHQNLNDLSSGTPVFADLAFATPWRHLLYLALAPETALTPPEETIPGDAAYIVLAGQATIGRDTALGPSAVKGGHRPISNSGTQPLCLVYAEVENAGAPPQPSQIEVLDPQKLKWRDAIHGGTGRIATRHIWSPDDFSSCWTFIDHAILGPHSSVGYHYHDALEECFIILAGKGYMTVDDRTFAVGPGSVTWQGIHSHHGIYNPNAAPLDFVRLAVGQPDEPFTTIDLHDDMTQRHPQQLSPHD